MNDKQSWARQALTQRQQIMAAVKRGAIGPERALHYARLAAHGEDISILAALTPVPGLGQPGDQAGLADQILRILSDISTALGIPAEPGPVDEYAPMFPPTAPLGPNGVEGDSPTHYSPPPRTQVYWKPLRYASASAGEITDAEAATLYPPRTVEEAEARHIAAVEARHRDREIAAGRIIDYDVEEQHELLFGDRVFGPGEPEP